MTFDYVYTPDLGRRVQLRPGTSDAQTWADTFSAGYHRPPDWMPAPATVLDCGANIGLTVADYQRLWPEAHIVAVEMDEESASLIEWNAPGVELRPHAISGRGGWGSYDPSLPAEAYSFRSRQREGKVVSSHTLRQVILRTFGDDGVDFVKLDIEGAEWGVFAHGAWAPLVRNLLVELHPDVDHADVTRVLVADALEWLASLGFASVHHPPHPRSVFAWR